jgi:hypothetical protein
MSGFRLKEADSISCGPLLSKSLRSRAAEDLTCPPIRPDEW